MKLFALVTLCFGVAHAALTCSTTGTRGSPPKKCPTGYQCKITYRGRPEVDIPNRGTCVKTATKPHTKPNHSANYNKAYAAFNAADVDHSGTITFGGAYKALHQLFPDASEEKLDHLTKTADKAHYDSSKHRYVFRDGKIDKSEFITLYNTLLHQQQNGNSNPCKSSNACGYGEACYLCKTSSRGFCCKKIVTSLPFGSTCMLTHGSTKCAKGSECLPVAKSQQPQIYDGMPMSDRGGMGGGRRMQSSSRYGRSYKCQVRPSSCEACVKSKGKWFGSHCITKGEPQVMDAPMTSSVAGCRKKTAMTKAKCMQYKSCERCTGRTKDKTYGQLCAWTAYGKGNCVQNQGGFFGPPMKTSPKMCKSGVVHVHG